MMSFLSFLFSFYFFVDLGFLFFLFILYIFLVKNFFNFFSINILISYDMVGLGMSVLVVLVFFLIYLSGCFDFFKNNIWGEFIVLVAFFILFLLFVFSTCSYFIFYLFFEMAVIPIFIMIVGWGYSVNRSQASLYMFLYTFFFSLPFLMILLYHYISGFSFLYHFYFLSQIITGFFSFLWVFMVLIFMVKLPIFFLHLWLPKAHVEAPLLGSMILAGVLLKLGGYGVLKSIMFISWEMKFLLNLFLSFSLFGGLMMSIICLRQADLKSLIAYSSVVHMGPVFVCMFLLSFMGFLGSYWMMFAHGLCSSCMFFLLNLCYQFFMSRSLLLNRGVIMVASVYSFIWFFFCIFNMGFPPSFNFFSELLSIFGMFFYSYFLLLFVFFIMLFSGFYSVVLFIFLNHGSLKNLFFGFFLSLKDLLTSFLSFFCLIVFMMYSLYFLC